MPGPGFRPRTRRVLVGEMEASVIPRPLWRARNVCRDDAGVVFISDAIFARRDLTRRGMERRLIYSDRESDENRYPVLRVEN